MSPENQHVTALRAGRREWIELAVISLACILYLIGGGTVDADVNPTRVQT